MAAETRLLAAEAAHRLLHSIPGAQDVYVGVIYTDGTDEYHFAQGLVSCEPVGPSDVPPRRMLHALVEATSKMLDKERRAGR